ncbi:MAG: DUF2782 domain-containing protein [Glaciimonas sp.]|nr:DUF2782 domain-containing protein [Glaciimonas sp.]
MRLSSAWITVGCGIAACAIPLLVGAQQPPVMEKLEEGEPPAISITPPSTEKKITEKRQQGKVTEVEVKSGNSTYYLKPVDPAGSSLRGDGQSDQMRAAQWPVLEFDTGSAKKKKAAAKAAAAAAKAKDAETTEPAAKAPPAAKPAAAAK